MLGPWDLLAAEAKESSLSMRILSWFLIAIGLAGVGFFLLKVFEDEEKPDEGKLLVEVPMLTPGTKKEKREVTLRLVNHTQSKARLLGLSHV